MEAHPGGFPESHMAFGPGPGDGRVRSQIAAVAIAPLSLVQAFAAGGLVVSVPLGARLFGHRIGADQVFAIVVVAVALASLPIALAGSGDRLHAITLIAAVIIVSAPAAISVGWPSHGAEALISGWTVLALAATFAGFLSFQAALRTGSAVPAISLMTAFAALVALACGVFGFGESLGTSPVAVVVHLFAVAVVLGCVPVLARGAGRDRR